MVDDAARLAVARTMFKLGLQHIAHASQILSDMRVQATNPLAQFPVLGRGVDIISVDNELNLVNNCTSRQGVRSSVTTQHKSGRAKGGVVRR